MKKISLLLCLLIITLINQLQAQEQLGIRTDNYAGINGTLLNPAAHLTTPFNWDVNLAGFSFFIDNNYAFLKDTRVPELLKYRENLEFVHAPDHDPERQMRENEVMLDYFSDKRSRFLQFNTRVLGPAFYVKLGQKHAVGAYLRGRAEMNGKGISTNFSYYDYFNRPYFENFPVDDFQGSFMTWGEIALNYMYQSPTETGKFGIGITAKIIKPYEAAFFHSKDFARLAKLPGDSLSAAQINLEYGFTTSNLDLNDIQPAPNGNGLAFDIGAVITIGDEENYKWKLGASILDLGKANFNENAQFHQARIDSTISIGSDSYNSFDKLTDLEALVKTFSQEVFGDSTATLKSNEFSVWLPAAFSLQIDHAFTENIYLNATLVQSLPFNNTAVQRGNVLALTPRFEHRWFGASMPIVLYNWQDLRMGMTFKLGFLYLGTDNLGSLVGNTDLTGTDFYAALKVNPFNLGLGKKDKGFGQKRRSNRGSVKCYDF